MKIGTKTALFALLLLAGGFLLGRAAAARPEGPSTGPTAGPAPASPTASDADLRAETAALRVRVAELEAEAAEAEEEVAARVPTGSVDLVEETADGNGAAIRVRLVDAGGKPVADREVRATRRDSSDRAAASDADGTVEFTGLESGSWWLAVAIPGGDRRLSVRTKTGWRAEVVLPVPSGAAVLEGTVRDREGPPRPGLSISLGATRGSLYDRLRTKTDAAGRYRFEAVPAGEWTLTAAGAGIEWPRQPSAFVTVPAEGTVVRDLEVGVPSLSGVVRNAKTGEPMAGVDVIVGLGSFYASNVTTDERGEWTAFDVRPGEVRVSVRKDGFVIWRTGPFELGSGETKRIGIELEPAAVVEARFLDASGDPVTKAVHLGFRRVGDDSSLSMTLPGAAEGRHEYSMLPPGDYEITGRVDGVGEATVRQVLVAGRANRVELRLAKR